MSKLLVENKSIVVPGETIAEGLDYVPGMWTYRRGEEIKGQRLGLVTVDGRAIKIIPLSGKYFPKRGDVILGKVVDVAVSAWRLEINSAYSAMLSTKDATSSFIQRGADLTQIYAVGDYVLAEVVNVTSQMLIDLTTKGPGLRKVTGGRIIRVNPFKVPRIIGKQGSMVSMIKNATGCTIIVGKNGLIWIKGDPENELKAELTIKKIEREAHTQGLTDKIKQELGE